MMSSESVNINTRSQSYDPPPEMKINNAPPKKRSASTPPTNGLQIENPSLDAILSPPKSTLQKSILNPNTHASQYYNIVEDLAQAPCTMSSLEELQTCPTQHYQSLEHRIPKTITTSLLSWMILNLGSPINWISNCP